MLFSDRIRERSPSNLTTRGGLLSSKVNKSWFVSQKERNQSDLTWGWSFEWSLLVVNIFCSEENLFSCRVTRCFYYHWLEHDLFFIEEVIRWHLHNESTELLNCLLVVFDPGNVKQFIQWLTHLEFPSRLIVLVITTVMQQSKPSVNRRLSCLCRLLTDVFFFAGHAVLLVALLSMSIHLWSARRDRNALVLNS